MIYRIAIPLLPLLEETENQTSVDFQGLRVTAPQVDAVYDDFTLSRDNAPEALMQMRIAVTALNSRFAAYVRMVEWSPDEVVFLIETKNRGASCDRMRMFIREFIKYSVLGWWYAVRNAVLAQQNAAAADAAAEVLGAMLVTTMTTRRLRWF